MRKARMSLVGVVSLVLLTGTAVPAAGQEATVTEDVLFEVVLPASAVPDPFRALMTPSRPGAIGCRR